MNLPLLNAAVNGVVTFDRTSFASLLSYRIDDLGHSDNSQQADAQRGRFVPSVASMLTLCPLSASLHSSLSLTLYRFSRDDVGTPHSATLARSPTAPIAEHQQQHRSPNVDHATYDIVSRVGGIPGGVPRQQNEATFCSIG